MIQKHIALIQSSFAQIAPGAPQVATRFYARLFALDPALRALFPGDMQAQGAKLMQALSLVVSSLHQLKVLLPHPACSRGAASALWGSGGALRHG